MATDIKLAGPETSFFQIRKGDSGLAIEEPTAVYPEECFQNAIVALLRDILQTSKQPFVLMESFGLDIAVFLSTEAGTVARFLEVKAYGAQRMGGVGFGNGRGLGSQVDLLLSEEGCLPLFNDLVRWVYADATIPAGQPRYCLFTCERAKAVAMGGITRDKQNNLRISALRDHLVNWAILRTQLEQFVLAQRRIPAAG